MDADPAVYEWWDLTPRTIPPRSRLFHLAPIGLGTPEVESLTSYVARLAEAHRVRPRQLVAREILPRFGRPRLAETPFPSLLSAFWRNETHALNGMRTLARDLVGVLETLTGRRDLHCLTLLTWAEVLSTQQLQRSIRAFCPACFEEWGRTGQTVYEPLLWTLAPITACPRHQQRLQLACPAPGCRYAAPWLGARSRPGYGAHCECWLGSAPGTEARADDPLTEEELAIQTWIVHAVGEILAAAPGLPAPPYREQVVRTLSVWTRSRRMGSRRAWARAMGLPVTAISNWELGSAIPSLWLLLQVCRCLGTAPLSVLTGTVVDAPPADPALAMARPFPARPVRVRAAFDHEAMRQALEDILTSGEEPPPSLREVARRLDWSDEVLRRWLPELCHAISARYLCAQRAQGLRTRQRAWDEAYQATFQVHAQGQYPSASRVAQRVSQPGSLRGGPAKVAWQKAVDELGCLRGQEHAARPP